MSAWPTKERRRRRGSRMRNLGRLVGRMVDQLFQVRPVMTFLRERARTLPPGEPAIVNIDYSGRSE